MSRILIADDQNDVLEALRILLKGEGHQTDAVTSLAGIFQSLEKRDYALLIMDLNYTRDTTSGQEGLEVIPRIQALDNTLPIVVMTAWATIDLAVEAMKRGARDFIPKPWDNDRLLTIVRTQIELAGALRKGRRLEAANQLLRGNVPNLIAESPRMRPVLEFIWRVGPSDANVRIVSATKASPLGEVAAGRFRQDLLFRLNTIEISLPPLRERREDIMLLANHFLRQHAKRYRKTVTGFEEKSRDLLMQHHYPGNVRELDHVVERAVLMTLGPQVKSTDLGLTSGREDSTRLEDMSLEEVEC